MTEKSHLSCEIDLGLGDWDSMSSDRAVCFVIMPFSKTTEDHTEEYWGRHFRDYLKLFIEDNPNVEARRSKPLRGDIVREIIKDLVVSPIVLADLTDSNANVYWELGVRQSFKAGTITIADIGYKDKIPFDIGAKSILFYYPNDAHEDAHFQTELKDAIQDCLDHPTRPDSAVLETVTGRGTLYEIVHREESIRRLDALLSELHLNRGRFKWITETGQKNQELRKQSKPGTVIPAERFRLVSTELLLTHRYLDEPAGFNEVAERYYSRFLSMNEQLNLWSSFPKKMEKWLLEEKMLKARQEALDKFEQAAKAARERLLKQILS